MTQAIMTKPGKIVYQEVDVPEVKPDQIQIKMKRIGICGSDIHVNHGKHPYTSYPVVQGHEVSAEVVEVGSEVTNCKVGDKVTIQPQVVCGKCYPCTHGLYNDCETLKVMGFQTTGMASDYFVVDAKKALVLPEEMSWDHGAMIEPLAVAVHAVRRFSADMTGKKAVVLGGGPIGNLVAQTAKALGAEVVLLSELSTYRRETAKKCGITAVNPNEKDLLEAIIEACGEDRADVIFECIGINPTTKQAIEYARKGSHIVIVGVFGDLATVDMAAVQDHELTLLGSAMYREEDFKKAIELVADGKIEFESLITHRFGFRDFKKGYDTIDQQKDKAMKVIINMEE
ncbi:zinc-dependent alcohol dehydrogenase [Faecalicatena contorta]|uniref:zinc-dependent alcohol dehydrogenase n=1 Tax=Lachnospiraceae TaxID=186803 RepID=UPI001F2AD739|nr:alcohol dehydrogenase catalytic domain-containing protein [Faecalicatena contorta]MCF2667176.1 alcohol dehydrogenase catalytic domain-containing protein [Faecalicatena contorta]